MADQVDSTTRDTAVHLEVVSADRWASRAADVFELAILAAIEARGRCVIALSGGGTPAPAFAELAARDLPWGQVVLTQADERVAATGSGLRNLTRQMEAFAGLPVRWLPLPVDSPIDAGIVGFVRELGDLVGRPPIIDVVHLGMGADGHTASLVPGDAVLEELDADVALTDSYEGRERITFTRPLIDRARLALWLIRGKEKEAPLRRWLAGERSMPAGLLEPRLSVVVADESACPQAGT